MDTSNFKRLSPLTEVYALENDKVYLVLCDAKHFSLPHAHSLLKDLRQMHPEVNVSIVVTTKPKSIKIMEQKGEDTNVIVADSLEGKTKITGGA